MYTVILVFHVLIAIALVGLILIQHGKGADAGAAFGSGASSTVFGSKGSGSFLTRLTAILAASFFLTSLYLAYLSTGQSRAKADDESVPQVTEPAQSSDVPAVPADSISPDVPTDVPVDIPTDIPVDSSSDVPTATDNADTDKK